MNQELPNPAIVYKHGNTKAPTKSLDCSKKKASASRTHQMLFDLVYQTGAHRVRLRLLPSSFVSNGEYTSIGKHVQAQLLATGTRRAFFNILTKHFNTCTTNNMSVSDRYEVKIIMIYCIYSRQQLFYVLKVHGIHHVINHIYIRFLDYKIMRSHDILYRRIKIQFMFKTISKYRLRDNVMFLM